MLRESIPLSGTDESPTKGPLPTCDEDKYRIHNVVERCVGRLKECRWIVTRFEKKASPYEAMLMRAFVAEYLGQ